MDFSLSLAQQFKAAVYEEGTENIHHPVKSLDKPTPAAMKIARIISAPRIPQNKTLCWWPGGTWK